MAVAVKQQSPVATSAAASTSITLTLPGAPTSGNMLVFAVAGDKNTGSMSSWASTNGWTVLQEITGAGVSGYMYYKVSAGTETSISPAWATSSAAGNSGLYVELEDTAVAGSTWQLSASSVPAYDNTAVNARSTGTTGAASAAGLAVASASIDSMSSLTTPTAGGTWSQSYTQIGFYNVSSGRAGINVATKSISASATTETTWSYTGTADQVVAAVGVFTKVSGGQTVAVNQSTETDVAFSVSRPIPPRKARPVMVGAGRAAQRASRR